MIGRVAGARFALLRSAQQRRRRQLRSISRCSFTTGRKEVLNPVLLLLRYSRSGLFFLFVFLMHPSPRPQQAKCFGLHAKSSREKKLFSDLPTKYVYIVSRILLKILLYRFRALIFISIGVVSWKVGLLLPRTRSKGG